MTEASAISVHPASDDRWDDVVDVMGKRGDPSRCWCQYFRLRGKAWSGSTVASNRAGLEAPVLGDDMPPGVLAYDDAGEPAGWCAVAPKASYQRLLASPIAKSTVGGVAASDDVWSITCFVVRVGWRRQGVARALVDGAVELARSGGATVVEAYPIDVEARASVSSSELYHGTLSVFLAAGFAEVDRPAAGRAIVRLAL